MVLGSPGFVKGAFVRDETGELEDLPRNEPPFVATVRFLHDHAHFPNGHLNLLEADTGIKFDGVEQHFRSKWDSDGTKHITLLVKTPSETGALGRQ